MTIMAEEFLKHARDPKNWTLYDREYGSARYNDSLFPFAVVIKGNRPLGEKDVFSIKFDLNGQIFNHLRGCYEPKDEQLGEQQGITYIPKLSNKQDLELIRNYLWRSSFGCLQHPQLAQL